MSNREQIVKMVADDYVASLRNEPVVADNVEPETKWFPIHDDEVTRRVKAMHQTLADVWKHGQVR